MANRIMRVSVASLLVGSACDVLSPRRSSGTEYYRLRWSTTARAAPVTAASANGHVFFLGDDHRLHAVNEASGVHEWIGGYTQVNGFPASGLATSTDLVIVPDFVLYAFDQQTGQLRWFYRDPVTTGPGYFTPVFAGDGLLTGSESGYAYHLRTSDGTLRWRVYVGTDSAPTRVWEPAVAGTVAVFSFQRNTRTLTGGIVALDLASGSELWRQELTPAVPGMLAGPLEAPIIRDSLVIVAGEDGTVHAFDLTSGRAVWATARSSGLGLLENELLQIAASQTSIVIASSSGALSSIDIHSGAVRWTSNLNRGESLLAPLSVHAGTIYTVLLGGQLVAVSELSGSVLWRSPEGGGSRVWTVRPLVTDSSVIVPGPSTVLAYRRYR